MPLTTDNDVNACARLGVDIIRANPLFTQGQFRTELEATTRFTRQDWDVIDALMEELEYTLPDSNFAALRNFWLSTSNAQERNIRIHLGIQFFISDIGKIARLTTVRDGIRDARDALNADIDAIQLWRDGDGLTAPQVVQSAVTERIRQIRDTRNGLNTELDLVQNQLAALQG